MDYTVGQMAKLCGISVRSLHHYEAVGLLAPARRSESGYRLYGAADVQRLHRILAFRQLGASLEEIGQYLGPNGPSLKDVLARQREAAEREALRLRALVSLIDRLSSSPGDDEDSITRQLIGVMNAMQSIKSHFSPEERETLESLRGRLSPAQLESARKELAGLLGGFRTACETAADVRSDEVRDLARRWRALGAPALPHPELRDKARSLLQSSADVQAATGVTPALVAYIDRAVAALPPADD